MRRSAGKIVFTCLSLRVGSLRVWNLIWIAPFVLAICKSESLPAQITATSPPVMTKENLAQANSNLVSPAVVDQERQKYRFEKKGAIVFRKVPDGEVKCDVYQPASAVALPAIVMIHGGAWRHGSKIAMLRYARRMARVGYVVVSINYRLAPKYPWPAQIDDCQYAVRWLKKNADIYNIDPDRIGVFGYSAGGHLAAMLGTLDETEIARFRRSVTQQDKELEKYSPAVRAVAVGGAPCEFSWLDEESEVLKYWMGGSRKSLPEKYRLASPIEYVTHDDPPFFIFHGTADMLVPLQSPSNFHQALKAEGISATFLKVQGAGHLATFGKAELLQQIIPFFDEHLQRQHRSESTVP